MAVGAVFDAQSMAVFVQQYAEHVHLAVGGSARLGDPLVGVGGGEVFAVVGGGGVDEPVVTGGVGVESDGGAGGLADCAACEVGEGDVDGIEVKTAGAGRGFGDFDEGGFGAGRGVFVYHDKHMQLYNNLVALALELGQKNRLVVADVVGGGVVAVPGTASVIYHGSDFAVRGTLQEGGFDSSQHRHINCSLVVILQINSKQSCRINRSHRRSRIAGTLRFLACIQDEIRLRGATGRCCRLRQHNRGLLRRDDRHIHDEHEFFSFDEG